MMPWDFAWQVLTVLVTAFCLVAPSERARRLRVGFAMLGGALLGTLDVSLPDAAMVWVFMAIDLLIAFVVLLEPANVWQRVIGLLYGAMGALTIGFLCAVQINSSAAINPELLKLGHDVFAWSALALLFLWGADGILGTVLHRSGHRGASLSGGRADNSP